MTTPAAKPSLAQRRPSAPMSIAMPPPAVTLQLPGDTFGMVPMRPVGARVISDHSIRRSPQQPSPSYTPTPWEGAARSPNVQVNPAAVDYFNQSTAARHSWRAAQNLGLVAVGRTLLTLGLAGVLEGFAPGSLDGNNVPHQGADMPMPTFGHRHIYHPAVFGLGIAGAAIGACMHAAGLARFYNDTAAINTRRAAFVLTAGTSGALLVTAGGAYYLFGVIAKRDAVTWEALPMRSVGNFLVYGAIPNSFSASEIVHGDIPLNNRIFWRDLMIALGGMFLMTWAQITVPEPPAPLWAREIAQCLGIMCIAVGAALPRVDGMRAQSQVRAAVRST